MSFVRYIVSAVVLVFLGAETSLKADSLTVPAPPPGSLKFYIGPDGRFYAAEGQKLYFHISDSPQPDAGFHTLQPLATEDSTRSLHLREGEYIMKKPLRGVAPPGKPSLITPDDFRIIVDGAPPATTLELSEAKIFKRADTTFYGPHLKLTLTAQDDLSGVASIVWFRNLGDWMIYSSPAMDWTTDEWNVVAYYSLDNVGNQSEPKTIKFYTDVSPPVTRIQFEGERSRNVHAGGAKIGFASSDNLSGVRSILYCIDQGKTAAYKSPLELEDLENGAHTLTYWAEDNVLNAETPQVYPFLVDKKPPQAALRYIGDNYLTPETAFIGSQTTLELSAVDEPAGVERILYAFDDDSLALYHNPLSIVKSGLHDFTYCAVDSVENKSPNILVRCFLDQAPPVSRHKLSGLYFREGEVYIINSLTEIEITSADMESGIQNIFYALNEGEAKPYETPIKILEDGLYQLTYHAIDRVNNVEERKLISLQVDNTPKRVSLQPKRAGDERQWKENPDHTVMGPANLDFFLKIATGPEDSAQSWLIDIASLLKVTGQPLDSIVPLLFPVEGNNLISMGWPKALREQFKVPIDGQPPTSQIIYQNAKRYTGKETVYFSGGLDIQFSAEDSKKGVRAGLWKVYYSIDGTDYMPYTQPLVSFVREKPYQIAYYAIDSVGNEEAARDIKFTIDLTAPESQHRVGGAFSGRNLSPSSIITLLATDNLSGVQGIYYRFDNNTERLYQSEFRESALSALPDGSHELFYYSVDNVGNREDVKSFAFNLNKKPPGLNLVLQGDKYQAGGQWFISPRTRISFASTEQFRYVKQIQYRLDNAELTNFKAPLPPPERAGVHHLSYRSDDIFGNPGATQSVTLYLDKTPPVSKIGFEGVQYRSETELFLNPQTKIILTASDQESGVKTIQYRISGGPVKNYTSPFTIAADGRHTIQYQALDQVNNAEGWNSAPVVLDGTPPQIELSFSDSPKLERGEYLIAPEYLIYIHAADALTKLDLLTYSINGAPDLVYRTPLMRFNAGSRLTLTISAVDIMNNRTEKTFQLQVQ